MEKTLTDLREEIDKLDDELLEILSRRIAVVQKIGEVKKINGIEPLSEKRRKEVLQKWQAKAKSAKLSTDLVGKIYKLIHKHSLELEKK